MNGLDTCGTVFSTDRVGADSAEWDLKMTNGRTDKEDWESDIEMMLDRLKEGEEMHLWIDIQLPSKATVEYAMSIMTEISLRTWRPITFKFTGDRLIFSFAGTAELSKHNGFDISIRMGEK